MQNSLTSRAAALAGFGASSSVTEELLRYNENRFDHSKSHELGWPLHDEEFVETWEQYAREVKEAGSIDVLSRYLVQLRFPIHTGISKDPGYLSATRNGADPGTVPIATGLKLIAPQEVQVAIHPTSAGRIPIILAARREDFISLVQALTRRNEPDEIPASMGACMVAGYNNWHRISLLRKTWRAAGSSGDWSSEFQRIRTNKELYQDRFIILSSDEYSGVPASDLGLPEAQWRQLSVVIRREHECTHYFTRRVFSSMRNNLIDELLADYMGIRTAFGEFRGEWLLRFMGLENFPRYRDGGRLQNYGGNPSLSTEAFYLLQRLVKEAAENLEQFDRCHGNQFHDSESRPALLMCLTSLTLDELASTRALVLLEQLLVCADKAAWKVSAHMEQGVC